MVTKFKTFVIGDFYWLGVVCNGKTTMLHIQGRVYDCIRPGQRMKQDAV